MADFNNTIETSTAMLHHFVCVGTYETYLGEYIGGVAPSNRAAADDAIGKLAVEIIAEALWDTLPFEVQDDFECEYTSMYSPRYYNFETDSANFTFEYSDDLKNWLFDYALENQDAFEKFLADNYTSRDGFISFTPNNWTDWLDGWNDTDWRSVSALINFLLFNEGVDYDDYQYAFDEKAREIIEYNFTPWEYAEKYENGWTGVCKGDWDNDEQSTIFTAWLLDADGNIVDTATIDDPYEEHFHSSAYAAWEYGDLGYDLTKDRIENRWKAEPCEAPEIIAA